MIPWAGEKLSCNQYVVLVALPMTYMMVTYSNGISVVPLNGCRTNVAGCKRESLLKWTIYVDPIGPFAMPVATSLTSWLEFEFLRLIIVCKQAPIWDMDKPFYLVGNFYKLYEAFFKHFSVPFGGKKNCFRPCLIEEHGKWFHELFSAYKMKHEKRLECII